MFDKGIIDEQKILINYVTTVGENIRQHNHIKENFTYNMDETGEDEVFLFGRLYAKNDGDGQKEKFSLSNAQIQLPPKFSRKVLEFSVTPEQGYFFRGQILAAKGKIEQGRFRPTKIYTDSRVSIPDPIKTIANGSLKLLFVAGPYVKSSFDELTAIHEEVLKQSPDCVIYLGPFLKDDSPLLIGPQTTMTAEDAMTYIFKTLSEGLPKCYFVLNIDDCISVPLYPVPQVAIDGANYQVTGDPLFIEIGQVRFFVTSLDIFLTMSQQSDGIKANRPSLILKSVITQRSMCPVSAAIVQLQHINSITPVCEPHFYVSPSVSGDTDITEFDFPSERDSLDDPEEEKELVKKEEAEKEERIAHNQYTTAIKFKNMVLVTLKEEDGHIQRSVEYIARKAATK